MCLTGAIFESDGSNYDFTRICEDAAVTGVIPDCDDGTCHVTFNNFLYDVGTDIYPYLFAALDTNGDNAVDHQDTHCQLNLLGFSWGGVNVLELAWRVAYDRRIQPSLRVVDRVIMLDAFQTFDPDMEVAKEVRQLWSYRHSVTPPSGDCSSPAPGGPYRGLAPRCSECSDCKDYDYSLAPRRTFQGILGSNVGHCDIPSVAHAAVVANLSDEPGFPLPPEVPVQAP